MRRFKRSGQAGRRSRALVPGLAGLAAAFIILGVSFGGADVFAQGQPADEAAEPAAHADEAAEPAAHATEPAARTAVAYLEPTEGNTARGVVTFTQVEGGVRVLAQMTNLPPGSHGFHIHQYGDCSAPDGTSAGGHFNPEGIAHGSPEADVRHVGDLGNIEADEGGIATYDRVDPTLAFEGPHNILGRGVVVHAQADDLTSQPTGAAGARLACGVIGATEPPAELSEAQSEMLQWTSE